MSGYGFSCFNRPACRAMLDTPFSTRQWKKANIFAGQKGWVIGHLNGQGQIACPDCAPILYDARTLDQS